MKETESHPQSALLSTDPKDFETPLAVEMRRLYTKLRPPLKELSAQVLMLTSAERGEGKSTTSANLAVTVARHRRTKTVLVDADLRRPTIHKLFEMPREPGLSDILEGKCTIEQALRPTPHSFLQVIPSGSREEHPGGLFERQRLSDTIEHLRKRFEIVIFDAPPVLPVADTTILAGEMDGVLMVIMGGLTPREVVRRAREILEDSNARLLGVVLNNASRVLPYYYEYSYYGEEE